MSFTFIPAFKETAFLLAVSSAALTHALAKACSSGRMERCTCDDSPGIQHREAWQWGVCGDNLKYSTKFLKKFLGQKRVSKDLRAQVDTHNINVGIRVSCLPKSKASKTLPTPEPHSAQLVGLQSYMTIIPLTRSCAIRGYSIVIFTCIFFTLPARQTPPYLLQSLALVDNTAVGEAGRQDGCGIVGARCSQA